MFEIEQEEAGIEIGAGEFLARVEELEQVDGKFGKQVKFRFEICDGDEAGSHLFGWTSVKFNPKSRLYQYAQAIIFKGEDIPVEYKLKSSDFIGKHCWIETEPNEKSDGSVFPKIIGLKPYIETDD